MAKQVKVVLLAAGIAVTVPATAQAATYTVTAGTPPSTTKELEDKYFSSANAYFPKTLSVRVGDKVRFSPQGFHNFEFPKRGTAPRQLLAPAGTATNVLDAAGQPFWFNGKPILGFNPALAQGSFGKDVSINGSARVDSGLPLAEDVKPMVATFTKTGSYSYFCAIHPGMQGKVTVRSAGATVPAPAAVRSRAAKQVRAALAAAKKLVAAKAPTSVVLVGQQGSNGVHRYAFSPATKTVKAGQVVTFQMPAAGNEFHTATFGPGNPIKEPASYLGKLAKTFEGEVFDPIGTYISEPAGTTATLTPQLHGNGFWNSGVMHDKSSTGLARRAVLRFGTPGTYAYYCLIHPFMEGKVVVQA